VEGFVLQGKSLKIASTMETENFSDPNVCICHFERHLGLVFKKLARVSAAVDIFTMDLWF
jgi:hypothetical protein